MGNTWQLSKLKTISVSKAILVLPNSVSFLLEAQTKVSLFLCKSNQLTNHWPVFIAVDRVIPEQVKRFEEEVKRHVEEESQRQR